MFLLGLEGCALRKFLTLSIVDRRLAVRMRASQDAEFGMAWGLPPSDLNGGSRRNYDQ